MSRWVTSKGLSSKVNWALLIRMLFWEAVRELGRLSKVGGSMKERGTTRREGEAVGRAGAPLPLAAVRLPLLPQGLHFLGLLQLGLVLGGLRHPQIPTQSNQELQA